MSINKRVILTSTGFTNDEVTYKIKKILHISFEETKVLIIPTARKGIFNKEKYIDSFLNVGFKYENLVFFDDEEVDLFKDLDIDMIYVCGGNTFWLQKYIRESNFDNEIKKYVKNGVVYVGASAGSHFATENIEHVSYFDENDVRIRNFEGLKLIDGILICHYDETREKIYEMLMKENKKVYTLSDTDVLYTDSGEIYKI